MLAPYVAAQAAVGGQAVMEGVMMRGPSSWAVALRRHNGEIIEVVRDQESFSTRHAWARVPILRGVFALGESLVIGFKALNLSAHYAAEWIEEAALEKERAQRAARGEAEPEPIVTVVAEEPVLVEQPATEAEAADPVDERPGRAALPAAADPDGLGGWQIAIAFIFALGFSIALFKLVPVTIVDLTPIERTSWWFVITEAAVKISIFCGYLGLVGLMPDMRRVFQYHSAEHKAINAWEQGVELTPASVNGMSRIHVRCGTAFMLWVFVVAIFVFGVFNKAVDPTFLELLGSRVILLPLVAGLSFELIRFAGRHRSSAALRGALAPGLWLQRLTTRACTEEQCEVAIVSLMHVLRAEGMHGHEDEVKPGTDEADEAAYRVLA